MTLDAATKAELLDVLRGATLCSGVVFFCNCIETDECRCFTCRAKRLIAALEAG